MAKLIPATRQRGVIQTADGKLDYTIKKAFKGALNYTVSIDGKAKFQALELLKGKQLLEEYIKHWK